MVKLPAGGVPRPSLKDYVKGTGPHERRSRCREGASVDDTPLVFTAAVVLARAGLATVSVKPYRGGRADSGPIWNQIWNQAALKAKSVTPEIPKCPIRLVGRQGPEPWTR